MRNKLGLANALSQKACWHNPLLEIAFPSQERSLSLAELARPFPGTLVRPRRGRTAFGARRRSPFGIHARSSEQHPFKGRPSS